MGLGVSRRASYRTFYSVLALIFAFCLFLPPTAAFAQSAQASSPPASARGVARRTSGLEAKLTLRVYNYAGLNPTSLAASEKIAGAILENVGIQAIWVDCPTSKANARAYAACDSDMGTSDLVLRILPHNMAVKLRRSNDSLGSAQSCPETEPACELNVFYHHVDDLARNGYRADRILGYVIAHEIGHVLLGPRHSDDGILRAEWSSSDLQRISLGMQLDFNRDQSRQLRLATLRRSTALTPEATIQASLLAP